MKTIAVTGVEEFTEQTQPVPECGEQEVRIQVAYTGICGSDIPRYFDGAVHNFPQVLGHEFSGTIDALGDGVTGLALGERVVVAPLVPCGESVDGNPAMCQSYSFIGSRQQGAMAEYVVVPAANVVPLNEELSLRQGALVEPMTVALHGIYLADTEGVSRATVLGAGVIGIMSVIALRAMGVEDVTVVDVNPWVLDKAREYGATRTINSAEEDLSSVFTDDTAPQLVVESAGVPATQVSAVDIAAKKGTVVFVGTAHRDVSFPAKTFEKVLRHELTLKGSWMSYSDPFPGKEWTKAQEFLATATKDTEELVTHEFPLDEAAAGLEVLRNPGEHRLKVMFRVAGSTESQ